MNDGAELRIHPTGTAVLRAQRQSQGQGHETTFAQIVAEELGLQPEDVDVQEGDTDNTPYGLGTYASRSTPVPARPRRWSRGGCATRRRRSPPTSWRPRRTTSTSRTAASSSGALEKAKTIQEVAFAAYTNVPEGMEDGLEGVYY